MIVYQLVPALHEGDAIGNSIRMIRNFLIEQGIRSEIYALTIDPGLRNEAREFKNFLQEYERDSITILHFMLPSPLTETFKNLSGKKVLIYHNVTPASFFSKYSWELTWLSLLARKELKDLVSFPDIALGDSSFNREELIALGFKNTAVLPLPIDFRPYRETEPSPFIKRFLSHKKVNILFVGRVVPNKKIEDLIKVASYYKHFVGNGLRLIVVGKTNLLPNYHRELLELGIRLKLRDDELLFTGHIPFSELISFYKYATLYLSLSEHEGFCLPLVEGMLFSLPIIAYNAGAVAETLGEGGILLMKKNPAEIAELTLLIATDEKLRKRLIERGRRRISHLEKEKPLSKLLKILREIGNL